MTHELHASIRLVLPEDGKEASAALAKATAEWAKLVHSLEGVVARFTVGEVRAPVVRRRRGRPRKGNGDAMAAADAFQQAAADAA